MPIDSAIKDAVELLIIKKNDDQMERIEKVYVKKADINSFIKDFLDENPYFRGLKWVIAAILITFFTLLIGGAFAFFSQFTKLQTA